MLNRRVASVLVLLTASSHLACAFQRVRLNQAHPLHQCPSRTHYYHYSCQKGKQRWRGIDEIRTSTFKHYGCASSPNNYVSKSTRERVFQTITLGAPFWTLAASAFGLTYSASVAPHLGSLSAVSRSLAMLMLIMGLTTTPVEVKAAMTTKASVRVLVLNLICCFLLMPMFSIVIPRLLLANPDPSLIQGTLLLGCVGGGQASNLFTLLAKGDVSLSVVCTVSTTLLAAAGLTPALVRLFLGHNISMEMNIFAVLQSTASLVLLPLVTGLLLGNAIPKSWKERWILPYCPVIGVGLTLLLVAGGAANSATTLLSSVTWKLSAACATLLPISGAMAAFFLANMFNLDTASKRTLVIEVLSKSPTVAYVLALKHFHGGAAASVPAAGMVSLAVVGAAVASIWSLPRLNEQKVD